MKIIYISGKLIQPANYFEVNMDQKANICQRSTTQVRFIKSSFFIRLTWNLKRIYISDHWIQQVNYFWSQHRPKANNFGDISKILNFHPIDLKCEDHLHIRSLNSTTNYFWGQICFLDFATILLCMMSSCLFVLCMISQKVVDGSGQNLVDRLGVWQGRVDSILMKILIQIWIRELFNFKVILHHWEIGIKTI